MSITITGGISFSGGVGIVAPPAGNKAIFGYGDSTGGGTMVSMTNLVSNTGVVSTDTTGVGTARRGPAATVYGTDKAIFGYGQGSSVTAITN